MHSYSYTTCQSNTKELSFGIRFFFLVCFVCVESNAGNKRPIVKQLTVCCHTGNGSRGGNANMSHSHLVFRQSLFPCARHYALVCFRDRINPVESTVILCLSIHSCASRLFDLLPLSFPLFNYGLAVCNAILRILFVLSACKVPSLIIACSCFNSITFDSASIFQFD